jgi:SM-20-related protein
MQSNYDTLIDSYLSDKVGVTSYFLDKKLCKNLNSDLHEKYKNKEFHKAGIGAKTNEQQNNAFRSDEIYWLDRKHENANENLFLDKMDDFILYLNRTCFTGITHCEFHYALYDIGSAYGLHKDQFQNNSDRAFSMIHYLNPDWKENDGGELSIQHDDYTQLITPTNGKSVFFNSSELPHEVLKTNQQRCSITGWLKTGG